MGRRKRRSDVRPGSSKPLVAADAPASRPPLAPILLIALGVLIYANSFEAPFIFDDVTAIVENRSLRGPILGAILAPPDTAIAGRPLAALSLALNYAVGGLGVHGYHAVNLALHLCAALVLFGIARRTLSAPLLAGRFGQADTPLAFAIAALWMAHPLNTEAVTYVTQRTELLMGLFLLLTLYAAIRAWDGAVAGRWQALSIACCALGMAAKEVMVSAPLLVPLYDLAFREAPWRSLWARRRGLYLGLASTWILLAALVAGAPRRQSVGFDLGMTSWQYLRSQCWALPHYLWLALWPSGLCLDYGTHLGTDPGWAGAVLIAGLIGATLWAWRHAPAAGFLGSWFFLILAPTSSILPIVSEVAAERRMYLPLVAVIAFVVAAGFLLGRRVLARLPAPLAARGPLLAKVGLGFLLGIIGVLTLERNHDYRSAEAIWSDVVRQRPQNPRACNNLGEALLLAERPAEAIVALDQALRIDPRNVHALNNLGLALAAQGRLGEALARHQEALRIRPDSVEARIDLGVALAAQGKLSEAVEQYTDALRLDPGSPKAHYNLGNVRSKQGREDEAFEEYVIALHADPDYAKAHNNLGALLASRGEIEEAKRHFQEALRIDPRYEPARKNLERIP